MAWRIPRSRLEVGDEGVDHEGVFEIGAPPLVELEALLFWWGGFDWWDVEVFVGRWQNCWILMMVVVGGGGVFRGGLVSDGFRGAGEHLDNMFEVRGISLDEGCRVGIGVRSGS